LFEPGELVRPSVACVRTIQCADLGDTVNGASRRARPLLGPFPGTKGPRPPGRTQANYYIKVPDTFFERFDEGALVSSDCCGPK